MSSALSLHCLVYNCYIMRKVCGQLLLGVRLRMHSMPS